MPGGHSIATRAIVLRIPALMMVVIVTGCAALRHGEPILDNPIVEHYRQLAEQVAAPEPESSDSTEPVSLGEGRPLVAPSRDELRAISLEEAVKLAIENNQILRQNAQFLSPQNPMLANPDGVASIYDPSIQNTGVLFGSRGTEAALSDFDPRFSVTMKGGRDALAQNSILQPGNVLTNDYTQSESRLDQQLMTGGIFSLTQNWAYSDSNAPTNLFNSAFTGALGAEFRQPLWAGAGRQYTAVAGPVSQQARGFSYVNQGVVIARINNRLAEIDFEENLLNLLREIGEVYWDLYLSFREFEAEDSNANSAKQMWDDALGKFETQLIGESEEAQAEETYHDATARRDQALGQLFQQEARLRRLLGLPIEDNMVLYPSAQPEHREIKPQRAICLYEALTNRIELRRQKTNIQSLELQLIAANNLANPRLDLVVGGSLNGFGRRLITGGTDDGVTSEGFNNAYASLLRGKETSWNAGIEYTVPLWLRSQRSQVHQLEFRVVKAKRALAMQEDEIARELYVVLQSMQRWHALMQSNRRRVAAAQRRFDAATAEYQDAMRIGIDPVLRAEMSLAQAKVAFHRSQAEYNKSLRDLLYRMGRLPARDGIELVDFEGLPLHPPNSQSPLDIDLPAPSATQQQQYSSPTVLPDSVESDERAVPHNVTPMLYEQRSWEDDVRVNQALELPANRLIPHSESDE